MGWPQAQAMSCRNPGQEPLPRARTDIPCKGWGTLGDGLGGHGRPRGPGCRGAVRGSSLEGTVSSRDERGDKPGFFPSVSGFTEDSPLAAGPDRRASGGAGQRQYRRPGRGQQPPRPQGSSWERGQPQGSPQALSRGTRGLRGSAQAHWDALTYTGAQPGPHRRPAASHGWKPPQGAAGSKRAESLGAERKG